MRPAKLFVGIISGYDAWCGVAHGCTRKLGMKICGKFVLSLKTILSSFRFFFSFYCANIILRPLGGCAFFWADFFFFVRFPEAAPELEQV